MKTRSPELLLWHRRQFLSRSAGVVAGGLVAAPALAQQQTPQTLIQTLGEGQRFDQAGVVEIARNLSKRPFVPSPNDLPDALTSLNYEQYISIKSQNAGLIWAGENRGFMVEPLHRGFVFSNPVSVFVVEDGAVRRIGYDRARYDFGRINVPANLGDIGYSGFRLLAASDGEPMEFAIIQGATFFRAVARGQNFGTFARALTLRPAETRGEEFPAFRAFWLERPAPGLNAITVHGVLDSESVSGAVRMTFRPGEATIVDVEMTLFPRVTLEHVGLGGMTSTFLFGPNDRRNVDDLRPAVYEAKGLQILNGQGEWLWRPLQNPETLQISAFVDQNPRAFGLLQRDRDFAVFEDDDQHFERRPNLWIEPITEWGQGAVQLIEIPSDSEVNDNILAYWRPRAPIAAGSEFTFSYRQFWCWSLPEPSPLASVKATRIGRGSTGRRRRFAVDFAGEILAAVPPNDIKATLTAGPGSANNVRLWPAPDRKGLRVAFELDPGNENASEMRLLLEAGGKPVSETWLYRWTP